MSKRIDEKALGESMGRVYMTYQAGLAALGEVIYADHVRPLCQARGWRFAQGTPNGWAFTQEDEAGEIVRVIPAKDDHEALTVIEMLGMTSPDGRQIGELVPEYKGVQSWGVNLTLPTNGLAGDDLSIDAEINLLPDYTLMMETTEYSFVWSIGELLGNGIDTEICPVIRSLGLQSGAYGILTEAIISGLRHAYLASVQALAPDQRERYGHLTGHLDNSLLEIRGGDQVRAWGRLHTVEKIGPGEYGLKELDSPPKVRPESLSPDFFGKLELVRQPESE